MELVRRLLRERTEAVALVAVLVGVAAFGLVRAGELPLGVGALGLVDGAALALHAVAIVLVYRSSRVINLAQLALGALAASLFLQLRVHRPVAAAVTRVCGACVDRPDTVGELLVRRGGGDVVDLESIAQTPQLRSLPLTHPDVRALMPPGVTPSQLQVDVAPGWLVQLDYWLSFLVAIGVAAGLVWLVYVAVIRRFTEAPRVILTVVTLAAGELALVLGSKLLSVVFPPSQLRVGERVATDLPLDLSFAVEPAVLHLADLMVVAAAVGAGVGLFAYLRWHRSGVALRAASENPQRASTLGIDVGAVTSQAWVIAGVLAGVAALLALARTGTVPDNSGTLFRALTAAVAGGLVGLPLTVAAALVIGVVDQVVVFSTGSQALVALVLLVVVVVLLLAQRARRTRADTEAEASWLASREIRPIPRELRDLTTVRSATRVLAGFLCACALAYPFVMSPSQTALGAATLSYSIIGMSLLVLTGWSGQLSLGAVAFAAVGAWTVGVSGLPFLLAIPFATVVGAAVAAVVGIPAIRLRGQFLLISTLGLAVATSQLLVGERYLGEALPRSVDRPRLFGLDFADERSFYYLCLAVLALVVAAVTGLRRSRTVRAFIACRDNEQAAQSLGIDLVKARASAFAVSGAIAAVAGGMLVYAQHGVEAVTYSPDRGAQILLATLVGGVGATAGPVLGGLYLGFVDVAKSAGAGLGELSDVLLSPGVGFVLLFIVAPGGLVQLAARARDAWLRRVASRARIEVPSLVADRGDRGLTPISPKLRPGGGQAFVPSVYRIDGQWSVDHGDDSRRASAVRRG